MDRAKPPLANIVELARLAGVSASTVSRALAGSTLVNTATRTRIQELATQHGFRPNQLARNLRLGRANTVGVIVPMAHEVGQPLIDPFFNTLIGHLADGLSARGYDLLLSRVVPETPDWLAAIIHSGRVDRLIVIGQSTQADALDTAADDYPPLVVWGAQLPGARHCTIGSDNAAGGALAAAHLIALGRRRLAFFGLPHAPEIAQRYAGAPRGCDSSGTSPARTRRGSADRQRIARGRGRAAGGWSGPGRGHRRLRRCRDVGAACRA